MQDRALAAVAHAAADASEIGTVAGVRAAAQTRTLASEISDRIAIGRLVLVLGIVWLHVPPYQPLESLGLSPLEFFKGFVSGALFRSALPVMTAISAYLLFTGQRSYLELLRKKFLTLVVPMFLWGLPVAAGIYFAQRFGLVTHQFSERLWPAEPYNWLNALFALEAQPANYPLYFLRDLFVLALVSPLVRLFAAHAPAVGFVVAVLVVTRDLDGPFIFRNDLLLYFYLGAVARLRAWDLTALDAHASTCLALLLFTAFVMVVTDHDPGLYFRMLAIVLVWPTIGLIARSHVGRKLQKFSGSSFMIFLAHGPLLGFAWMVYQRVFTAVPYFFFWLAAPIVCVCTSVAADMVLKRIAPKARSVIVGGR